MIKANLELLQLEYFLRLRNQGEIVWETKKGDLIPIYKMSDKHLINTIKMLKTQEEIKELRKLKEELEYEALSSVGDMDFI